MAYLIHCGAPAELIQRALALGALPSGDVSVRESPSAAPLAVTNLHFAVLKGRFDAAQLLIREGHRAAALNANGETAFEQYAKVAPKSELRAEATAIKIGLLVRKSLAEGIRPEHLTRLIDTLCRRGAWAAAEIALDECTLSPQRAPQIRIPRSAISEIAWQAAAQRGAPASFFDTLRTLHQSEQVAGELSAPAGDQSEFLAGADWASKR